MLLDLDWSKMCDLQIEHYYNALQIICKLFPNCVLHQQLVLTILKGKK